MSVFSGEFLGFRLGKIHSSSLNITRVSSNDRYTEDLTPVFKDRTTEITGNDGLYYWGSYYTQQNFVIDFAFDDLREEDIHRLRNVFSFKGVQELVFDETPYKKYMVKCSNPPTLKYIAFGTPEGTTVYKGEGTANLVAYYPYALGIEEKVLTPAKVSDTFKFNINNIGDLEAPFKFYFWINNISNGLNLNLYQNNQKVGNLTLDKVKKIGSDTYICIDSKTNLIEGIDSSFNKTSHLYNKFITDGDLFKLPAGTSKLYVDKTWAKLSFYEIYY